MDTNWARTSFNDDLKIPHYWRCPSCGKQLSLEKQNLTYLESRKSIEYGKEGSPYCLYHFSAILNCYHCYESVSVLGSASDEFFEGENTKGDPVSVEAIVFKPKYFLPPLHLFEIPEGIRSEKMRVEVVNAFALFLNDLAGCANKIRNVIEMILNEKKIKKKTINKHGRRVDIKTHDRIVAYREINAEVAEFMLAIKFIGNNGSHAGEMVRKRDLMKGFDFLEHILQRLYGITAHEQLLKDAREISKRRGRPKRAKRLKMKKTTT